MKIIVGSKNPVKIKAVENIAKKIWLKAEVSGIETNSGVKDQPTSKQEAIQGAINRAKYCLKKTKADFGLGLEGYVYDSEFGMFLSNWVAAIDSQGRLGLGGGGDLLLPEKVALELRKGKELGPIMDELLDDQNTKQKQGAVGTLTNNLISRTNSFEKPVIFALARFITPEHYDSQ
jgi:inosine/xanthosine triphosphatase